MIIQKFGNMHSIESPYHFITIEGNIGAGKTSLATKIAEDYDAKLILEQFEDNSFLPKFYNDPERYAFPLELSFLAERYQQLKDKIGVRDLFKSFTVSDYFINKSLIFSRKTLPSDEFKLYQKFFNIINQSLIKPEILVYLYANVDRLQSNIKKRGRNYEQDIEDKYLEQIQESYFDFIKQQNDMRILIIDTNDLDFVNNQEDYKYITSLIFKEYTTGIHRIKP
jgi:deoxyadenosine/deoxycytidine kinase